MKFKPFYIYIIVFIAFIVGIVLFSTNNSNNDKSMTKMPEDDIHKSLQNEGAPSKDNVTESAIKRLNELKKAYDANPSDTLKMREYADMLTMAHKPTEAISLYNKILAVDGKRIDVLLQLTFLHYNNGDFDKAESYTNKILSIDKNNFLADYNLGAIEAAKGNNTKAKLIWQNVIKKYPNENIANIADQSIKQLEAANPK